MGSGVTLFHDGDARSEIWTETLRAIDAYLDDVADGAVTPDAAAMGALLETLDAEDFTRPVTPREAIAAAAEGMRAGQVHPSHPRYFGLFNPPATTMGIAADALVAAWNPQLATQSHAPFAVAVERHVLRAFGERFGFARADASGTFTSGGAEANMTAILVALTRAFPEHAKRGVRALAAQPVFYASAEAHHSLEKAARMAGLGADAVRRVSVDAALAMRPEALRDAIARDRAAGDAPFMIVATCGTTSAGAVDPIASIAEIAERAGLWLHVDAAWGGFAALLPELRALVRGCDRADSITFDAHKSLAVPMGAGMFLTRHPRCLADTFATTAEYMPRDGSEDPYACSPQWSRRFIGLKVFLSLAVAGWSGYEAALREVVRRGDELRARLAAGGWRVLHQTQPALPIVCFVDATRADGASGRFLGAMVKGVASAAWISMTRVRSGTRCLRACITNPRTSTEDVDALVRALGEARAGFVGS